MPTEPVPVTDLLTDIEGQWTFSNVSGTSKKPGFIEVNGANEPLRYNLNVKDQIIPIQINLPKKEDKKELVCS